MSVLLTSHRPQVLRHVRKPRLARRRRLFFEGLEDRRVLASGVLHFGNAVYSAAEGSVSGSIVGELEYSGETSQHAFSATVNLTAETATGADFTSGPIQVEFDAGTTAGTTATFSVPINDDLIVEGTETLTATIGAISTIGNDTITAGGGAVAATLNILDNDSATFSFESASSTAAEGDGLHSLNLNLVVTANGQVGIGSLGSAAIVTLSGDAGAGVDYNLLPINVAANAESGLQAFTVAIVDDTSIEGTEVFNISIDSVAGTGNVTGSGSHELTIEDNDNPPTTTPIPDINVDEDVGVASTVDLTAYFDDQEDGSAGLTFEVFANTNADLFASTSIDNAGLLTLNYAADANGMADITIRATDSDGFTADNTVKVVVNALNDAPAFAVGSDITVNEDFTVQLVNGFVTSISAGGGIDENGQTVTFDVTTDNDDLVAQVPTIDASGNLSYQIADGASGSATVTVVAMDDGGTGAGEVNTSASQTFEITAQDVIPVVTIVGPTAVVRGELGVYRIITTDTAVDAAAGFTFDVDWGDGTVETNISGGELLRLRHQYEANGDFDISVTATNQDGDVSVAATSTVNVSAFTFANGMLKIGGRAGDDVIVVRAVNNDGRVRAAINGNVLGRFNVDKLRVYANAGNDRVVLRSAADAQLNVAAVVLAGTGNDVVNASTNAHTNVIVGSRGNDILVGGTSRDILIGGTGRDVLVGRAGEDIMVGGRTRFDARVNALDSLMADWNASGAYSARVSTIRSGERPNLNKNTVLDDNVTDRIYGGADLDLYLASTVNSDPLKRDIAANVDALAEVLVEI